MQKMGENHVSIRDRSRDGQRAADDHGHCRIIRMDDVAVLRAIQRLSAVAAHYLD